MLASPPFHKCPPLPQSLPSFFTYLPARLSLRLPSVLSAPVPPPLVRRVSVSTCTSREKLGDFRPVIACKCLTTRAPAGGSVRAGENARAATRHSILMGENASMRIHSQPQKPLDTVVPLTPHTHTILLSRTLTDAPKREWASIRMSSSSLDHLSFLTLGSI